MILSLIKKDLKWYLFYYLIFMILPPVMLSQDGFNDGLVVFVGACLLYIMTGSAGIVEIEEDRYHGYQFMKILPVSGIQIATSKFILPLISGCLCILYTFIFFSYTAPNPDALFLSRVFIILIVAAGILLVGLFYVLLFLYGMTAVLRISVYGVPFMLLAIPIAVRVIFKDKFNRMDVESLLSSAANINWWLLVFAVLTGYVILMLAAARINKRFMR